MEQESSSPGVQMLEITEHHVGQRIDNFLLARLKGVPKSRIYRIIRKGEVRVNSKRVKPEYKLALADSVRIPPVRVTEGRELAEPSEQLARLIRGTVLYEDADMLVVNKPSGLPVHGGTGVKIGLIEALRYLHPEREFLELAHRLDKGTSGCLMVALNGPALRKLFDRLRRHEVDKRYHAIVRGHWPENLREIDVPLFRHAAAGGERFVEVSEEGKSALTHFRVLRRLDGYTLIEARPRSGRTHQIRVHALHAGHPIAGDEKYGDPEDNRRLKQLGIHRLCLHAAGLELELPAGGRLRVEAPYDEAFREAVERLGAAEDRSGEGAGKRPGTRSPSP